MRLTSNQMVVSSAEVLSEDTSSPFISLGVNRRFKFAPGHPYDNQNELDQKFSSIPKRLICVYGLT